jgi:hypothetical protein
VAQNPDDFVERRQRGRRRSDVELPFANL